MCTLIVYHYPKLQFPIIVAANRDEDPNRPAEEWKYREKNNFVYSPLDVLGGTWVGINKNLTFCAITNWDVQEDLHNLKSRGLLVYNALKYNNCDSALNFFKILNPRDYKPFNILYGNKDILYNISCDHNIIRINKLNQGCYISTGLGFNIMDCKRDIYIRENINPKTNLITHELPKLLSSHNDGMWSDDSVCVHDKQNRWGTRSSTIFIIDNDKSIVKHIDRPPCKAKCSDWHEEVITLG